MKLRSRQRGFVINPYAFGSGAPATPQPTFANVVLLLHCDEKPFIDASSNQRPVVNVSSTLGTSNKKFGAGAFTCGTGKALWCPASADFALGATAWCAEAWVYWAGASTARIFDTRTTASNTGAIAFVVNASGVVVCQVGATAYGTSSPAATVSASAWTHVAASYDGTTLRTWVNGALATATVVSLNVSASNAAYIGNSAFLNEGDSSLIDDVRVTKGEAIYTAAFTAPGSAHPDTGIVLAAAPAATYANVVALLHGDGTNGSTTFTDNAGSPHTFTAAGNAQISTAQSQFGGASIALDGTGDWLSTPAVAAWDFSTGDFTLEAWVRITNVTNNNVVWSTYNSTTDGWALYTISGSGVLRLNLLGGGLTLDSPVALSTGVWHHVAACRISGKALLFVDGELQNYAANTSNLDSSTALFLGQLRAAGDASFCFTGYIDDARIVKGQGVYPRSFLVPTAAFPNS